MSLEIKKNKKKLYQERNSKRKKKYNNQKLCDNNEILIINKKLDLQGFCNGKCVPIIKKNNYCINFNKYEKIFFCDEFCCCNKYYCNNNCKRKYNDLKMLIEQEIAVYSYIIKRIIIPYDDFNFTTKFEFEYKKINPINNMKEYYEVINNPNLSFNDKPSKNWFFKILLCICLIFRDKLNMNYSSYHTDLIFSFIYY